MPTIRTATLVHEHGMAFAATTGTGRAFRWGDDEAIPELSPGSVGHPRLATAEKGQIVVGVEHEV